jgi:pyruvate, water dikinase
MTSNLARGPLNRHILMLAVAVAGCSSGQSSHATHVVVQGAGTPPAFQATLAFANGPVQTLVCPSAAGPGATQTCTDAGFDVVTSEASFEVTLRSVGNAFSTTTVNASSDTTTISVQPLAASANTANYATRLDGDTCLSDLQALGVLFSTDVGDSFSVKFYMRDLKSEPKVYFQNTRKYPLHFDFAQRVLGVSQSADQFAVETYSGADRSAMAGTLILYPSVGGPAQGATPTVQAPWTLNFFPSDLITPEQIRLAHRLIEERLTCLKWTGAAQRLVYLPASAIHEQQAVADATGFERKGIGWMSHADLFGGIAMQALNPGVSFGTLKRMTPEQLAASVVSFRDILLLTRIPNELPIVGGSITEEFQTPLAHVNVAARTRGTPNLAYPKAFQDPKVSSFIGKLVRFEVKDNGFSLREASLDEVDAFWNGRTRDRYVPTFDAAMTGIPSFDQIGFADSIRVGVKAANLAELSHFLGENAPDKGLAVPFHYYDQFMSTSQTSAALCDAAKGDCTSAGRAAAACQAARDLCMPAGTPESLNAFLARVTADSSFKQDTALRDAVLGNLRFFIENSPIDPTFAALLDSRIAEVFQTAKVKIRSSTNCEDLPNFSGAGLYNSYGAHASGADAGSKVINKVFSSVWSFRGFEERSFWNIDHTAVRMGCAINQAFTDELANGVLITANIADPTVYGMYVNVQKGEESVTNPTNGALPEMFSILGDTGGQVVRQRFSSLSPTTPLLSDDEVAVLHEAATKARAHFAPLYGLSPEQLILDMEFKLTTAHKIVFKQARPYTPSTP